MNFSRAVGFGRTVLCMSTAILALTASAISVSAQDQATTIAEQDGLSASLKVESGAAVVRWRFLRPLPSPLADVSASINQRPLGVPIVAPYPTADEQTGILLLVDVTDTRREPQIIQDKLSMLRIAGLAGSHQQVAIAVYSEIPQVLLPEDRDVRTLINLLAGAVPRAALVNLNRALDYAIWLLSQAPAQRRGVYIFTDGHSDDALKTDILLDRAKAANVSLNFVVTPSERPADLAALTALAQATGGEIVIGDQRQKFEKTPYERLDSGGSARFPIAEARRYFWEGTTQVKVTFRYGDRQVALASDASVPPATAGETAGYLMRSNAAAILGVAIVALGGFGFAVWRKRREASVKSRPRVALSQELAQPAAQPEPPLRTLAVLQDIESGTSHPVNTPHVRIGRNQDNDIVLSDPSVGRFHAVLQQVGDRVFSIVDQSSANGTLVNNKRIDTATLAEGDLISLGSKVLRFHKVSRSGTVAEE